MKCLCFLKNLCIIEIYEISERAGRFFCTGHRYQRSARIAAVCNRPNDVVVARSDTAMIMHISADRSRVDVISIPRDTIVDIPSCTFSDGSTVEESEGQFNTAFANGAGTGSDKKAVTAGVACTIKTVEALTDVYIDESIVVDFSGLSTMVDALGGVTLYVDEDIDDSEYTGLVLERGCHHLDGATAL